MELFNYIKIFYNTNDNMKQDNEPLWNRRPGVGGSRVHRP